MGIRTFLNGNNVIEKIAKYLILSVLGFCALTFVAVLVIDDDTIKGTTGPAAETLLDIKHGTLGTVSSKADTFVYWIRTKIYAIISFSPSDRTPRVVMRIPPPPENVARTPGTEQAASAPAQDPIQAAPEPPAETSSASMPAAPENTPTMPEEQMAMPDSPPAPEAHGTPDATMPAEPVSAMGHAPSVPEGAPEPAPVAAVNDQPLPAADTPTATTEQASLPAGDAPPPPPSPEEAKPGEADYQQGLKYYNGDGVEQNFGKAAQFFMKAGEDGHVGAQYNLGIMNYTGQTGGQDFANAAKWFERAANAGHTQAQYNLGFLYYEGKGVAQDLKTAFDWINRAAEQGYPKAIKARDAFKQAMPELFEAAPKTAQ